KLAEPAIAAVEQGKTVFVPEQWTKTYFHWMRNIEPWCVSRQLWWGHQIPAWYCEYGHVTVARETPRECETCHSGRLTQDPDVLDTWFSSGLWPFSTLGWPDDTPALRTFYPNSVMETGFDILFFWVARMAMLGLHFMGDVPFRVVFLHAMVRDKHGEKMSKTRGNVIDPLDITAKYGADALRFTLASMAGQGRDIKLDEKRIEGYRAFANKIWNAARFVLRSADGYDPDHPAPPASVYDRWILSRFQRCADETRQALEELRLNDAANGIYRFVWGELCDWAIELAKPALYGDRSPAERAGAQSALLQALEGALRLLHPFMPFVTEEVWQRLPKRKGHAPSIMVERYPAPDSLIDPRAEAEMDALVRAIDGARSVRGEVNLPPNQAVPLVLVPRDGAAQRLFETHRHAFARLANASDVQVLPAGAPRPRQAAAHVEPEVEVHLPLAGLIDFGAEKARVTKELQRLEGELAGIAKRLDNPGFLARAPAEVVEKDRARAAELEEKRDKLTRHLDRVTRAEDGMNEQKSGSNGGAGDEKPEQGHRSMDQMGTHGGPSHGGGGDGGRSEGGAGGYGGGSSGTGGEPGSPSAAPKEGGGGEGAAEQAFTRVKNLARGLMEKAADVLESGVQSAEGKLGELAKDAAKFQESLARSKRARPTRAKPSRKARPAKAAAGAKGGRKAAAKRGRKAAKPAAKKQTRRAAGKATRRPAKGGRGKKTGAAKRGTKSRRSRR
ncbi:MAG: class I tRNA ligase family protein, partial [Myxococcales bacterium]